MSERNTALLIPGHVPPAALVALLFGLPGVRAADFTGDEAPRVGHGERAGHAYTVLALRVFEVGGLLLLENPEPPAPTELEAALGVALSRAHGAACFLLYDEEQAFGGYALFRAGALVRRDAVDGRWGHAVRRQDGVERPMQDLDPSNWVWPALAEAVEAGATPLVGPGIRNDDDIEALLRAANPAPVTAPAAPPKAAPAQTGEQAPGRKRDRVLGLLRKLSGR